MKIYIVEGHTGEYSDRCDWGVKAFTLEEDAKDFVVECTKAAGEIAVRCGGEYYGQVFDEAKKISPDQNYQSDNYGGTHYSYYEIELVEN